MNAGLDADTGGTAHRTGGVGVGEALTARSEPIDVGGVVEAAPEAAEVRPAEVVDQEEDEVRPFVRVLCGRRGASGEDQRREEERVEGELHRAKDTNSA